MQTVPVVPGKPIVGNLFELRKDRIAFFRKVPELYGDVARARVGIVDVLVVSSAEIAHEALATRADAFHKGYGLSVFAKPLLGDGLVTSEEPLHMRQRRLVAPAFVHKRIGEYADVIGKYTDAALARMPDGAKIDLSEEMMRLTFEIVGQTLFNTDLSKEARGVGEGLTAAMRNMMKSMSSLIPLPPFVPTPNNLRGQRIVAKLDEVVYRLIRERRAEKKDYGDFLSMLLLAQDEDDGSVMTDKQVRDEAMTIMMAGHETTANALAWTFYLLAKHPEAREKLEREVDQVLGGRVPTLADCARLPYAMQVFKESMRLYPPAYVTTRKAIRDVSLGDLDVKKGQLLLIDIIGMHRRAKYFPKPNAFDPERFSADNEKNIPKHAYIPFGGGPRICIGNHFALMEGQMALAHLAQHARFELEPESREVTTEPLVTLRPRNGVHVKVARRTPARDAVAPSYAAS